MKKNIKLTEKEILNVVKKVLNEQSQPSVPFESIAEFMVNEFNVKNNKKISVTLTFDGQNIIANIGLAKYVVKI